MESVTNQRLHTLLKSVAGTYIRMIEIFYFHSNNRTMTLAISVNQSATLISHIGFEMRVTGVAFLK